VYEHYNYSTGEYNEIEGPSSYDIYIHFTTYADGGFYRCWERCSDTEEEPLYCYHKVQVVPDTVMMNFTQAILNKSYNGSCSAEGYPPPMIQVKFDSNGCNFTTALADDTDEFTTQLIIIIPMVTEQCWNVTISCSVCQEHASIQLNVTTKSGGTSTTQEASLLSLVVTGIVLAVGIWNF